MEATENIYQDKDGNIVELSANPETITFLAVAKGIEIPPEIEEKMKHKKVAPSHNHAKKNKT